MLTFALVNKKSKKVIKLHILTQKEINYMLDSNMWEKNTIAISLELLHSIPKGLSYVPLWGYYWDEKNKRYDIK